MAPCRTRPWGSISDTDSSVTGADEALKYQLSAQPTGEFHAGTPADRSSTVGAASQERTPFCWLAAAAAGRFADGDLASVIAHQALAVPGETSRAGEDRSLAQGTGGWAPRSGKEGSR